MSTGPQVFVQFGEPEQWVIVHSYSDNSGLLSVFGHFESEKLADEAAELLRDGGVDNQLNVMPLRKVVSGPWPTSK